MYHLSNIFFGDYPTTRYGLGIKVNCPAGTPLLAGASGVIQESNHTEDRGAYVVIRHSDFLTIYEHVGVIGLAVGDFVPEGTQIATSGEYLLFGVASLSGAHIDALGDDVLWDIKGHVEPVQPVLTEVRLSVRDHGILDAQATQYRKIMAFLTESTGFTEFLKLENRVPIDLEARPDDPTGSQSVTAYIGTVVKASKMRGVELINQQREIKNLRQQVTLSTKKVTFRQKIKNFIFIQKPNIVRH